MPKEQPQSHQQTPHQEDIKFATSGQLLSPIQEEITEIASDVFRDIVVDFLKYGATLRTKPSNIEECKKLTVSYLIVFLFSFRFYFPSLV